MLIGNGKAMIGRTVSHYKIVEKLGGGGMGVVYKAIDLTLERPVALKFLPPEFGAAEDQRKRMIQEAKAASALDHPNICNVHEIDQTGDGQLFIVMAYYEGETLKSRIERGPLPEKDTIDIAIQVAQGLAKAHEKGLIHRDIKPANLMITRDGVVKIVDFGLAKETQDADATRSMAASGTGAYMSPEQVQGLNLDQRTDIWSLGATMYEMLAGRRPFREGNLAATVRSILGDKPEPLSAIRPGLAPELGRIVARALAKDRESRYRSANELVADLTDYRATLTASGGRAVDFRLLWRRAAQPKIAFPAVLVLMAVCAVAGWAIYHGTKVRWARERALPEAARLAENQNYTAAFALARQAEKYIPGDAMLERLWPEVSAHASVHTAPAGADVYMREYSAVKGDWQYLGKSPLEGVKIPLGFFRWRVSKPGLVATEFADPVASVIAASHDIKLTLHPEGETPPGMVLVPGGNYSALLAGIGFLGPVTLTDYWIDRYEVTNRQFKEFVDQSGYQKRQYWKNQFAKDGRTVRWEQAMAEFHDDTGRPGPATWEAGGYPSGQEDFPVAGISWYEAAAYAEFAGKRLPTIYEWYKAANVASAPFIIPLSNFGDAGPARSGAYQGIGPFGTYDMAGNVKEWCWNEESSRRYLLGGAWNDPSYNFSWAEPRTPWDRSRNNGFRCIKYSGSTAPSAKLFDAVPRQYRDFSKEKPVSDEVFQVYRSMYAYERSELNPAIESEDSGSEFWRRQKIAFDAAYGNERVTAYLFLPRNRPGPFQAVIFFPGAGAVGARSSPGAAYVKDLEFLMKTGRAVLYPVYKGTYERSFERWSGDPAAIRDRTIQWRKDLGRSIDYLETRKDIDAHKLAYCGHSMGSRSAPILLAIEDRIKAAVLLDGGFNLGRMQGDMPRPLPDPGNKPLESPRPLPEADALNFAPRMKIPTLMLNGRYDFIFPVEAAQNPLFRALGTPDRDKRHVVLETPHNVFAAGSSTIRIVLDWLDHYLGPVQ